MNGVWSARWGGAIAVATAGWLATVSPQAHADDFAAGSYIIPMDLDYQDEGILRAYGLVYALLLADVPIRWTIRTGKLYGEDDFTATAIDVDSGMPIGSHDYRGGPFVIDAFDALEAEPIIADWLAQYPETTVHESTEAFTAEVARYLVVAPTIAMVADGNEDIARGYMQAAGIPDSTLSLDWDNASPDMLDVEELAGPTDVDHADGALFDADGHPVYCQLMSMHWAVNDAEQTPEVVAEVRAYLGNPVHFFAECQAVNAFENSVHGRFLTPNGFEIGDRPDEVDFLHMDSPFGQIDGAFQTVGGSEPAYSLPPGDMYLAGDITMLTEAGTPEGINDVWMTGFLDGACPPDQHECGTFGKVSYLGGHEFRTDLPVSANADTQGTRMFLNSLFEAPCATVEGLPTIGLAVGAPAQTIDPAITLQVAYSNTSFVNVLDVLLVDPLPPGMTFVGASNGGVLVGDEVQWDLGNLGPQEAGDVTVDVTLDAFGTYPTTARMDYRVGLNERSLGANLVETVYADMFDTTGSVDDTGGGGSGTGVGGTAPTGGPDPTAAGSETSASTGIATGGPALDPTTGEGCSCRTTGTGGEAIPWLLGVLGLVFRRRTATIAAVAAVAVPGCGGGSGDSTSSAGSVSFGTLDTGNTAATADSVDESGDKLDTPAPADLPFGEQGCEKIDFLFIIDSSESMKDHQENLVASFPGFVTAMQDAVQADDWHVMVVDTDGQWNGADCANACASLGSCPDEPAFDCGTAAPLLCDITTGAGEVAPYGEGASNQDCDLGSVRYIDAGHEDLAGAFACVATVGVDGSSLEHTADALVRALSDDLVGPSGCNEGFLRDDAILVVTLITDEPDEVSKLDPTAWHDALVAAKNADETAVVMLGLLPDADVPVPLCDGPVAAPRLGALLESFAASTRASVCEPDYSPFLSTAVDVIADTCEQFEPPA